MWHGYKIAYFKYRDGELIERFRIIHAEILNHLLKNGTGDMGRKGQARPERGDHCVLTANHLLLMYFCVPHLSFLVSRRTLSGSYNKAWVMRDRMGWNRAGSIRAEEIN